MTMAQMGIRLFAVIRGLIYASGFVLLWYWVVASVQPLDNRIPLSISESLRVPGLVIAILDTCLALWCIWHELPAIQNHSKPLAATHP